MTAIRSGASARIGAVDDGTATDRGVYDGTSAVASQLDTVGSVSTLRHVTTATTRSLTSS